MARRKGVTANTIVGEDQAIGNADEVISIAVVASACRHLLLFLKQQEQGVNSEMFFSGRHQGDVERVMLYRNGWDTCSFGSFCRQAGSHFAADQHHNTTTATNAREKRLGKILSDISERGVDLLASTLCKSNYALISQEIITLFPGGVPCNFEPCQSDHALFQIHVTKITIQNRMLRLEQDVNVAKRNAVKAQRNDMTQLAMVHMRRRKAVLEELERCASILTNLDSSELRLERAKNDVQLVQSYTLLKTALQDIRASNDIMGSENVEDLMLDIREEMEDVGEIGGDAIIYPEVVIDEDELNKEFKLLEMECEKEQCSEANDDEVQEKQSDERVVQPLEVQQTKGSDNTSSKAEAVAA
mmetsp:Transcript_8581/g.15154  ORF Transcript_8581/g.15154 Transcript_8581/m.15154 type:complete len:358 (+) Transcript_8581:252-1325(+)